MPPFVLIAPASRGLSRALTRYYLRTTSLPVYATHRSTDDASVRASILADLPDVDHERVRLLHMELTSEDSIADAAQQLKQSFDAKDGAYIHTAFFTGAVLHPERQPADLDATNIAQTFATNVTSHLLCIKYFSQFLPGPRAANTTDAPAKWVHVSARVGSVSDNRLGGWYAYRASKAALNQVIRTFDIHLQNKRARAMCVGVHPGTVKTDLSKDFWGGVPKEKLFEPEYAAELLAGVVGGLKTAQRGRVWDWAGKEVVP
ncbi:NAD(P)-binding protein [Trametopsis cervina]|nr:NAD(P)-binding protein [Trametopsis cervina]